MNTQIKVIGVVLSDYATESDHGICLPVDWVWQGEKVLENIGEVLLLCGNPMEDRSGRSVTTQNG